MILHTFLTGIFQRCRESFCPFGGFTSAEVAMRCIRDMSVPAFLKSSPLCHRKGALLMSDGSRPAHYEGDHDLRLAQHLQYSISGPEEAMSLRRLCLEACH